MKNPAYRKDYTVDNNGRKRCASRSTVNRLQKKAVKWYYANANTATKLQMLLLVEKQLSKRQLVIYYILNS